MQDETRRCGNCGNAVREADITCPHCGALLAAYEAAPGSVEGTTAAVNPVSMTIEPAPPPEPVAIVESPAPVEPVERPGTPGHPYQSVTGKSLSDLEDERLEVGAASSSLGPGAGSPITEALRETRKAADLDDPDPDDVDDRGDPPAPSEQPFDLAEAREVLGLDPEPKQAKPSRATRQSPQERPAPEQRAAQRANPAARPPAQRPNPRPGISIQALLGALFVIVVVAQALGARAFLGIIVIPVLIIGLLWFMRTMARNTGRKSTTIPRDRNRR